MDSSTGAGPAPFQLFRSLAPPIEAALKASIYRFGVLVPVVKDQHGNILDGHQRVRLADELGVKYPVNIIEVADDEEAAEIARTLNEDRRPMAKEDRLPIVKALREEGHSLRAIAGAMGVSQTQVKRDLSTVTDVTVPDRVKSLDGKSRPARKTPKPPAEDVLIWARDARRDVAREKVAERDATLPPAPAVPNGKYRCIVIDPPWPMDKIGRDLYPDQVTLDYPTMTMDEIAALPVGDLAAGDGCHVYLWTTHRFLPDALRIMSGWGVRYQCVMTWVKNVGMTPFSWMYSTEHVLFGRTGSLPLLRNGLRLDFSAPRREHSRKPEVFYERVIEASPEPRLEMFAREAHTGFAAWGNETRRFA